MMIHGIIMRMRMRIRRRGVIVMMMVCCVRPRCACRKKRSVVMLFPKEFVVLPMSLFLCCFVCHYRRHGGEQVLVLSKRRGLCVCVFVCVCVCDVSQQWDNNHEFFLTSSQSKREGCPREQTSTKKQVFVLLLLLMMAKIGRLDPTVWAHVGLYFLTYCLLLVKFTVKTHDKRRKFFMWNGASQLPKQVQSFSSNLNVNEV